MSAGRKWLTRTVAASAVGSAVAIFAVTRTWAVQVQAQPAPQAPLTLTRTGVHFVPWLSALGLVGLAGTGALLATRGRWRSLVGALIALCGVGVAAGGVYGLVSVDRVRAGWPLLCVPAGLLLAAGGALAAARGADWPALGERYERTAVPRPAGAPVARRRDVAMQDATRHHDEGRYDDGRYDDGRYDDGRYDDGRYDEGRYDEGDDSEEAPVQVERSGPSPSEIAMWDALDRGEDPSQ